MLLVTHIAGFKRGAKNHSQMPKIPSKAKFIFLSSPFFLCSSTGLSAYFPFCFHWPAAHKASSSSSGLPIDGEDPPPRRPSLEPRLRWFFFAPDHWHFRSRPMTYIYFFPLLLSSLVVFYLCLFGIWRLGLGSILYHCAASPSLCLCLVYLFFMGFWYAE